MNRRLENEYLGENLLSEEEPWALLTDTLSLHSPPHQQRHHDPDSTHFSMLESCFRGIDESSRSSIDRG